VTGPNAYRDRFSGLLEDEFPRIPLTTDRELFTSLAASGSRLVRLHLLEEPLAAAPRIEGPGDLTIGDPRPEPETERLWVNATQWVEPVSQSVWETKVGGYQVVALWLRNRRRRRLTGDEGRELTRILGSLTEAEPLKVEIEALVEDVLEGDTLT
jgi:hypothetical protein